MKVTQDHALLDWVRSVHASTQWTTAVCTGVFLLGSAGLLSDIEATTHWASTADLARYNARYHPARFVQNGGGQFAYFTAKAIALPNTVTTTRRWLGEILRYFEHHTTSGVIQNINTRLKLINRSDCCS